MNGLTHLDENGKANMVDVTAKAETERYAKAEGRIRVNAAVYEAITEGTAPKGDVLAAARIAGIMAAKKTPELIPLCHTLLLTKVSVDFRYDEGEPVALKESVVNDLPADNGKTGRDIICTCEVKLTGKTGAEMEALTGVSVALLTVYDMCKAVDKSMVIHDVRLLEKDGGKSGHFVAG